MSEKPFLEKEFEDYIESEGWTMVCQSPLELQNIDGSFASMQGANALLRELKEEFKELEKEKITESLPATSTIEEQDNYLLELNNINDKVQIYIKNASESTDYDAWDLTYERIFNPSVSQRVFSLFNALHVNFNYSDPDTTYEEDVTAFATAFNEKVKKLNKLEFTKTKNPKTR